MPTNAIGTVIKLIVASLAVGVGLRFFDISPQQLLENFGETIQRIFAKLSSFVAWGLEYVILGAVIVVPIWGIFAVLRLLRSNKKSG